MTLEGRSLTGRGAAILLAAAALLVIVATQNPQTTAVHGDGYYTYLWARTLVFDHDVDFGNDYRTCTDPWGMASMPHGLAMNQWSPGAAVFFAPILAFDVLTHHPALDNAEPLVANGCIGALAERAVRGSVVAGVLVLLLAFLAARRVSSDGIAALAAGGAVLGGPVVYYATILLSYGHASSAALGGLAVWAWIRARAPTSGRDTSEPHAFVPSARGRAVLPWLGMGAALGLAMLARPQNAVLVILPLWHWIDVAVATLRAGPTDADLRTAARARATLARLAPHVGVGIAFTLAMLATFGLQLYQWWHSTGEIFLVPQGDYYLRFESPRVANLLFSSANGLFPYCPLAYVAVGGLVALSLRRRTRAIGLPLVAVLVVTTWLNACVADWWGAVGFAARRYDAMTVPFAIGIAHALAELEGLAKRRAAAVPGLALGAVVVLGAISTSSNTLVVAAGYRSDLAQPSTELWGRGSSTFQRALFGAVGNPLAWPASLPFAIRYGVHPRVWDQASMPELFFHRWLTLETQRDLSSLDLNGPHGELAIGFDEPAATLHGTFRTPAHGRGRVLLPLSYPYIGALDLEVDARPDVLDAEGHGSVDVWLALDDEVLGTFAVRRGQARLVVPVARPHQGISELRMAVARGTLGVSEIEIRDRDPHPSVAQARRNARLRARRIAWRISRGLTPEGME